MDLGDPPLIKSADRQYFEQYLRTVRRPVDTDAMRVERKFNPYHDPRNGQFTFAPGGPRSLAGVVVSDRGGRRSQRQDIDNPSKTGSRDRVGSIRPAVYSANPSNATLLPAAFRPNPRVRSGGNGGPPLNDPPTLVQFFPGIATAPGGAIVSMADNFLDLTGPGVRLTASLAEDHINQIIRQIRTIDPNYRLESLGFPSTLDGQINLIRQLRIDRATAFYRLRGEVRPLQVEALRKMQERADRAYDEGVELYQAGRLKAKLSREEAIGNYVDRAVRRELREMFNSRGVDISPGQPVRVIGREYDTSGTDRTYRVPDARVGNIAYDVTLTRKTLATPQVRGFFATDFKPDTVVIIRPRQLGPNSSYAITSPRKHP
ncbi:hypothetical protein BH10PSE13_BH10PSE13_21980 [soil metagenome]